MSLFLRDYLCPHAPPYCRGLHRLSRHSIKRDLSVEETFFSKLVGDVVFGIGQKALRQLFPFSNSVSLRMVWVFLFLSPTILTSLSVGNSSISI